MNKPTPIRTIGPILAAIVCLLPATSTAFDLIEFELDVTISDWNIPYTWNYSTINGPLYTGFKLENRDTTQALNVSSTFNPDLGLQIGAESLQEGFVLFDGTLYVGVSPTDTQAGRANIRATYRMEVRRDWLRSEFVRNLIRAQLGRAEGRAQAGRIADARLMRYNESTGTWIRAARAIRGRATIRDMGRARADGILGHYGHYTDDQETSYVWAVTDTNSRYAVGLAVDRDADGILNIDDNCPELANPSQLDTDGDADGDACDTDDDNDGVSDVADNCPLHANPFQADFDGDGAGDVCDTDDDGDLVGDEADQCLATGFGAVVNSQGCSIVDLCPCDNEWKNHGAYVRCVARTSESFLGAGLISEEQKDATVSEAGRSECGTRN